MASSSSSSSLNEIEEDVQRVLQVAGLGSSPIDPPSMEALREYVKEYKKHHPVEEDSKPAAKATGKKTPDSFLKQPPPQQQSRSVLPSSSYTAVASVPNFTTSDGPRTPQEQILDQLTMQTNLLMDMQRQILELTQKVERLESGGVKSGRAATSSTRTTTSTATPIFSHIHSQNTDRGIPQQQDEQQADMYQQQQQEQGEGEGQQQQPQPQPPVQRWSLIEAFTSIPASIRNSRIATMIHIFFDMRRQHVRNVNAGLMLKIIIVLAILSARLQSRKSKQKETDEQFMLKMYGTVAIVAFGFLYQAGYFDFLYMFFFKENIPFRVWNREEINIAELPRPPLAPLGQARQAAEGGENNNNVFGDWRQTFLGGVIARNNANPVIAGIQDAFYLVGSFFFSIFPMWRPEAEQVQEHRERQNRQLQELQQRQQQQQQLQQQQQIPNVAPPIDPTGPADDDSDDNE